MVCRLRIRRTLGRFLGLAFFVYWIHLLTSVPVFKIKRMNFTEATPKDVDVAGNLNRSPDSFLPFPNLFLLPPDESDQSEDYLVDDVLMSPLNLSESAQVCKNVTRPSKRDVTIVKGHYHKFWTAVTGFNATPVYLLNFFVDDRFSDSSASTFVRAIVSIRAAGATRSDDVAEMRRTRNWKTAIQHKTPFFAQLWFDGFAHPVAVTCKLNGAAGLARNINGVYYNQYSVTCPLPNVGTTPRAVSNSLNACSQPLTYVAVVQPRKARAPAARDVGVCMASLYGRLGADDLPYFVSWMETLQLLGVSEVTVNNALMHLHPVIVRAFQHYHRLGRLFVTSYPVAHEGEWAQPGRDDAATESMNKVATAECFYRNVKRYWWTLIIDLDEIPVPRIAKTYQAYLTNYFQRFPHHKQAHCLTMRSAFFYLSQEPGAPEYPVHTPVLRYTRRFEPEPMGAASHDGIGIAKSFHNPRNVVASGHHVARASHTGTQNDMLRPVLPVDEIMIHHYRKSCKYGDDCRAKWNKTINDQFLPANFGRELRTRIDYTLKTLEQN